MNAAVSQGEEKSPRQTQFFHFVSEQSTRFHLNVQVE